MSSPEVDRLLRQWSVEPTGPAVETATSTLVPGIRRADPVMLKIAHVDEERRGTALLAWWRGAGAVAVLEREGDALLMARATGGRDLVTMAEAGRDGAATNVLVDAVLALHAHGRPGLDDGVDLVPLEVWFEALLGTDSADPVLLGAAAITRCLLDATRPDDVVALHGDMHHGNVLDLGDRWAAIDPKALLGHRAFDFANMLCNPSEALAERHVLARLERVAALTDVPAAELAAWTVAWCGLSLAWEAAEGLDSWHGRATRAVADRLLPLV